MAERTTLHSLVPLLHVRSVPSSISFYASLGFSVSNTHTPEGGAEPVWAELQAGGAHLMVSRTADAAEAAKGAVLLYVYAPDVEAYRTELLANGILAGVVEYPF